MFAVNLSFRKCTTKLLIFENRYQCQEKNIYLANIQCDVNYRYIAIVKGQWEPVIFTCLDGDLSLYEMSYFLPLSRISINFR